MSNNFLAAHTCKNMAYYSIFIFLHDFFGGNDSQRRPSILCNIQPCYFMYIFGMFYIRVMNRFGALCRYAPSNLESWSASHLLGEHVGGSAVRSLCFISKIYAYGSECMHDVAPVDNSSSDYEDNRYMLISVGAKQVLTSWLLRNVDEPCVEVPAAEDHSSMSFQWLSTHIPPRLSRTSRNRTDKGADNLTSRLAPPLSRPYFSENLIEQTRSLAVAEDDNDWRYLAVTAFVIEDAEIRYADEGIMLTSFHIC